MNNIVPHAPITSLMANVSAVFETSESDPFSSFALEYQATKFEIKSGEELQNAINTETSKFDELQSKLTFKAKKSSDIAPIKKNTLKSCIIDKGMAHIEALSYIPPFINLLKTECELIIFVWLCLFLGEDTVYD